MSKQSKSSGSGNILLLAGLGVGAFMLFANKSNAQSKSTGITDDDDIPAAPKILAVNSNATESPLPTGIVSDEEGMEATETSASAGNESLEEEDGSSSTSVNRTVTTTTAILAKRKAQRDNIPPLISTKLTAKEKSIIDKGLLSDTLAAQRPDLYKAIYIRKHGKNGNGQKALLAADALIQNIHVKGNTAATAAQKKKRKVAIRLSPHAPQMVMAAAQAAGGGMAAMAALTTINTMQYANNGRTPARKPVRRLGSKGTHAHSKPVRHATSNRHAVAKQPAARHRMSVPEQ